MKALFLPPPTAFTPLICNVVKSGKLSLNEVAPVIGYNIHCLIKRILRNYHKTNPRKIYFKNIKVTDYLYS
jgi:hypothetical protein